MNKEEVLRKSRGSKEHDEGQQYFVSKGLKKGFYVFTTLAFVISLMDLIFSKDGRAMYATIALQGCFSACIYYGNAKYKKSKMVYSLVAMFVILAIFSFIRYVTLTVW